MMVGTTLETRASGRVTPLAVFAGASGSSSLGSGLRTGIALVDIAKRTTTEIAGARDVQQGHRDRSSAGPTRAAEGSAAPYRSPVDDPMAASDRSGNSAGMTGSERIRYGADPGSAEPAARGVFVNLSV